MRTPRAGYVTRVGGVTKEQSFELECPHCHKRFAEALIEGGAARYRGFKCPHCKLFVPLKRATDAGLSRDPDSP